VFEIVTIDPEKKRIGVAPVPEGSSRAAAASAPDDEDAAAQPQNAPVEGFGSLADKLRGALRPKP
jgi:hypothetical protein